MHRGLRSKKENENEKFCIMSRMICTPQKHYFGNQINENERGRAYGMNWGGREVRDRHTRVGWGKTREKLFLEGLRVVGRAISKRILKKYYAMT